MYPCCARIRASSSLSLEAGTSTVSCAAETPLRMRVRKSAIGSVIVISEMPPCVARLPRSRVPREHACRPHVREPAAPSPRRLRHARDLAAVGELPQADPTDAEAPVYRPRPPAARAASIRTHAELRLAPLLDQ